MRLITREAGSITITIFTDTRHTQTEENANQIHRLVDALDALFQERYTSTYNAVHGRIIKVADAIEDNATEVNAIREEFRGLREAVERLVRQELALQTI